MDRALVNPKWLGQFPSAYADFLPSDIFDHSPIVINIIETRRRKGFPFKFYNYWTSVEHFPETVDHSWSHDIEDTFQFQLCYKLRNLKHNLKTLAKDSIGREKTLADKAREDLVHCQRALNVQPKCHTLRAQEAQLMGIF